MSSADIRAAAQKLLEADALLVTAGAGMGVDSGLPDFRGTEGFWRAYPAVAKLGLRFEEMANPHWFERDPELAWAFYGHRLNLYRATEPHAGFRQLLEIGKAKAKGCFVFTSNVDGHFQKAGFERVVECHGSILHLQCCRPCGRAIWEAPEMRIAIDDASFRAIPPLPPCPSCGSLARPNVLMFGDGRWLADRTAAQETALSEWLEGLEEGASRLAIVEAGAGTAIPTVRRTSEHLARRFGASFIRINPREPQAPPGAYSIQAGAGAGIEDLAAELRRIP
jgi:NAD-dependent SIR2 family protein deacetylase